MSLYTYTPAKADAHQSMHRLTITPNLFTKQSSQSSERNNQSDRQALSQPVLKNACFEGKPTKYQSARQVSSLCATPRERMQYVNILHSGYGGFYECYIVYIKYDTKRKLTPELWDRGWCVYMNQSQVSSQVCATSDAHPGSCDQGMHHLQALKPKHRHSEQTIINPDCLWQV